jgi:hypothetical protein
MLDPANRKQLYVYISVIYIQYSKHVQKTRWNDFLLAKMHEVSHPTVSLKANGHETVLVGGAGLDL